VAVQFGKIRLGVYPSHSQPVWGATAHQICHFEQSEKSIRLISTGPVQLATLNAWLGVASIIAIDKQTGVYSQGCEGRADKHRPINYLPGKSVVF
jgi:hypothetical protein